MGVYIKGMEMPKTCYSCVFMDGNCCLLQKISEKAYILFDSMEKMRRDCPLVEVKAPHGRLIDVVALNHAYYQRPTYPNLCNAINNAPTVLEAEGKDDG